MIVLVYLLGQQNTFLFLYYSELPIASASNAISFDAQLYLQNKRKRTPHSPDTGNTPVTTVGDQTFAFGHMNNVVQKIT